MPLGLILFAEKSYEHMGLLRLEESGMYVAGAKAGGRFGVWGGVK